LTQPPFYEFVRGLLGENIVKPKTHENMNTTDAAWLTAYRSTYGLCQSDIAAALCFLLKRPINQGRVAEIETGQRCLNPEWRAALLHFFNYVEAKIASGHDWRDGIFS
jgi:hypothetical protein